MSGAKGRQEQSGDGPDVLAAIDAVARHAIGVATSGIEWGDYPEIGEDDWNAVVDRIDEITQAHEPDPFNDAYALLESRAESSP